MMCIGIGPAYSVSQPVPEVGDHGTRMDLDESETVLDQLPVRSEGFIIIKEIDLFRSVHTPAGFQTQIVVKGERLFLFLEAVNEMEMLGNQCTQKDALRITSII
jgi:hypothetical protein